MEMIYIRGVKHVLAIPAEQIARIEAKSNYSKIYLLDGKQFLYSRILSWFEERLPQENFLRINRGQLINKKLVSSIDGALQKQIILHTGECFVISRRRETKIKKAVAA